MIGNQAELYITVDQQYTFGGRTIKGPPPKFAPEFPIKPTVTKN